MTETTEQLTALAKKTKKNGIAVDIVNIGVQANIEKLQAFVDTVNNADNSHMVHIDAGAVSVADMIISSPINTAAGDFNAGSGGMGGNVDQVDPNMDPELAEAIRQSLEEQKQMLQASESKKEEKKEAKAEEEKEQVVAPKEEVEEDDGLTEEERLQRAIMLSLEGKSDEPNTAQTTGHQTEAVEAKPNEPKPAEVKKEAVDLEAELLQNADFVNELIKDIPGMTEDEKNKVISSLDKKQEGKKEEAEKDESEKEKKK